ncbi:class I SAM-dependent rRNA methyltransferase [Lactobacillus sp. S2-2]|uniref:class I SAM-dependent methyltransferase n=1 Tax=Lactobacillus sp. S2-2 TaxID=2692917 RepID=UPI001F028FC2|nr:class I SAM-dependent methyltransferase [Lactobacillus sp. S2-2]MCF6515750.1 class I SAM-dependent rRNA methyltransferase [Lactobacillus sp. S2-2]
MRKIEITGDAAKKFEGGYPLISLKDLNNSDDFNEGQLVSLVKNEHFVASAYFGKQNTGIGWVLSRKENQEINQRFFERIFTNAFNKRNEFFEEELEIFRLFNGQGDNLGGITVDYFNGNVLISWDNQGIYQYRSMIIKAITNSLTEYSNLYDVKKFESNITINALNHYSIDPKEQIIASENTIKFPVNLDGNINTGIDVIYRDIRTDLKDNSSNKMALNLFHNQTGFVGAEISGGTLKTTNVDSSKKTIDELNDLFESNQMTAGAQENRSMDVMGYLDYAQKHELKFDLITIKIPMFFKSKKGNFQIKKDLNSLLEKIIKIAASNADIYFVVDTPNFSMKKLNYAIKDVMAKQKYDIIKKYIAPDDFTIDSEFRDTGNLNAIWIKLK